MARSRSPAGAVANATDALASARERAAGLLPNPSLGWERESVGPGGAEDVVRVTVPVDVAGPRVTRSLAASEGAWMHAEASLARTDAALAAALAYYEVVLAQRRVEVCGRSVADLDEAARVVARREAAGSASGYESARLAIATELGRSRLAEARAELQDARVRLAAMLGVDPRSLRVDASLSLLPAGAAAELVRRPSSDREAIRHARASERLAARAQDRSAWTWLPTLELGAGMKHTGDPAGDYGHVLGVSVSIPIFDRGQALRAEAGARRALSAARADALARTVDGELRGALAAYRSARQELERFESRAPDQVEALLRAAQSGYREGERSIVELLDAQRAQTEVAERRLVLLGAAKRAEARLRAAAGAFE